MSLSKKAAPVRPLASHNYRTNRRSLLGAAAGALAAGASSKLTNRQVAAQEAGTDAEGQQSVQRISVFPPHNTRTASPYTEISFRGITAKELGPVDVEGSASGGNSGVLSPHADGNGASYLPDARFEPGERVTVQAGVPLPGTPGGSLQFHVSRPGTLMEAGTDETVDDPQVDTRKFKSRPDLQPPVMKSSTSGDVAPGHVFVAARTPKGQNGCMILDNDGEVVWFGLPPVKDYIMYDFRVQQYQGKPSLTWFEGVRARGFGRGHFVIADTSYERIAAFQVGNGFSDGGDLHEFRITSRGTALVTIYYVLDWDLSPVGGSMFGTVQDCIVQEVEIETGRVLFEWHSLDHIGLDESFTVGNPDAERVLDPYHINSIQEQPDGNLLISNRNNHALYLISRQTGEIIWRLGGKQSDFAMGPATGFGWQHDARIHANGELTLFDNHEVNHGLEGEVYSRGLVLALDEERMTATFVRQYVHTDELLATSQGNMQVLPNDNVFIGWGSEPFFSEFTHDGEMVFNGEFPDGAGSYRAFRHQWKGAPSDPPDITVEITSQAEANVYASWNGATEVASWRVSAGPSKNALTAAGTAKKAGFETTIPVEIVANFYAVEALDADGKVIGTSARVQPIQGSPDDAATRVTSWIAPRLTRPTPIRNEFLGPRTYDPGRSG